MPFKGKVEGEYTYYFGPTMTAKLKQSISTETKVTDRRTGFFEQVSGSYKIDQGTMAAAIVQAYNTAAILQATAIKGD